jgi:hypothetical protein
MTFDPSIDCRNDLINHYGYTRQQVSTMPDNELFAIMDDIEDAEKGFNSDYIPEPLQNKSCKCGGKLKLIHVDCETRGDCEIYKFECVSCHKPTNINYAEEWYD